MPDSTGDILAASLLRDSAAAKTSHLPSDLRYADRHHTTTRKSVWVLKFRSSQVSAPQAGVDVQASVRHQLPVKWHEALPLGLKAKHFLSDEAAIQGSSCTHYAKTHSAGATLEQVV